VTETFRFFDFFRKPSLEETLQRSLNEAEHSLEQAIQMREYYTAMEKMYGERIVRLKKAL